MQFINKDGCGSCAVMGHAMFCACSCHNGGPTIREQLEAKGFVLGAQWWANDDDGLVWERLPFNKQRETLPMLTVVAVNYDRGEITVRLRP